MRKQVATISQSSDYYNGSRVQLLLSARYSKSKHVFGLMTSLKSAYIARNAAIHMLCEVEEEEEEEGFKGGI